MNTSVTKYGKAILNLIIAAVVVVAIIWLLPKVLIFFLPFLIGWIIAMIASPMAKFLEKKLKIKRKAGSVVVVVLVIGLVVLAGYFIGAKLVRETIGFIQHLPEMWASLEEDFAEISKKLSVIYDKLPLDVQNTLNTLTVKFNEFMGGLVGKLSSPTIAAVGNFAKQLPTILIGIIMCLLSSYLFVSEREQISQSAVKYLPEGFRIRMRLLKQSLAKAVGGYLKAQVKIEVWIYLLLMVGFLILGVNYALLIALGVAFMDFLPFFGTGTIMVPWAIVKFLSADYKMTIGLLLLWGISQLVRQVIQPKIVGDSVGMAPIPTLFLLYIGYMTGGVLGMIVAVPAGLIIWTLYQSGNLDTTKNSILILSSGINHFRKLTPKDKEIITEYRSECEEELRMQQAISLKEQQEKEAVLEKERQAKALEKEKKAAEKRRKHEKL